jgi:hypothetical protein
LLVYSGVLLEDDSLPQATTAIYQPSCCCRSPLLPAPTATPPPLRCHRHAPPLAAAIAVPPGPLRDSPHRAVIPCDTPEYQCPWFQFYRASNFYCMAIAAEPSLPSGPPSAADWVAVSVTVASETTRHAPGAVRRAGGDELQRCRAVAAAAAAIATTKIGRTWIATMPRAMTSTRTMGMGGPRDWPCACPLTG